MMSEEFDWSVPPLDAEDQRLAEAYLTVGRPVDALPYTEDFEKIRALIGAVDTNEARHHIYLRLLRLRMMGRLPRLGMLAN